MTISTAGMFIRCLIHLGDWFYLHFLAVVSSCSGRRIQELVVACEWLAQTPSPRRPNVGIELEPLSHGVAWTLICLRKHGRLLFLIAACHKRFAFLRIRCCLGKCCNMQHEHASFRVRRIECRFEVGLLPTECMIALHDVFDACALGEIDRLIPSPRTLPVGVGGCHHYE